MAPVTARPDRLTTQEARRLLDHERRTRLEQLTALEQAGSGADGNLVAAQEDAVRRVLAEVDAALDRLAGGTYGFCEGCAAPVPSERLEILPYARRCVACHSRAR